MNEKHGPNGFVLGLIIGGAIGAFVSTKKGRQILKDIAEYGLDYIGNSVSMEDIETILNEDEEEMMAGEMTVEKSQEVKGEKIYVKKEGHETAKSEEPSRRRRLFRGIKK